MFRTIFSVALIGAANAVSLHKADKAAPKDAFDVEEALSKAQSGDYTTEDVENVMEQIDKHMKGKDIEAAIDWAAENDIGFEEIQAMIEGVEVSGAFDKHDIYDFAMDVCCHYQVTEEKLDEMLHYAGQKLGITAEEGNALLETAGEVFDISQEEFDQAVQDCYAVGAKCAAKAEKKQGEKREKDGKKAAKEGKKAAKEGKKAAKAAKEAKLAEKADWKLEDLLEVNLDDLTAEDVANFLKEHGEELMKKLHERQTEVVAWIKENWEKIEMFVEENMEELKQFAEDLEKELGQKIDWDEVKAKAEAYYKEGMAKLNKAKKAAKDKRETKLAEEWSLEDALDLDLEELEPEDVADFLKAHGDELKAKLEEQQEQVVAWIKKNATHIKEFVSENEAELKEFAAELEKLLGDIDWEAVKAEAEEYFKEGCAKIAAKKDAKE